jgi:ATP/maltotriose-dependent transcriptional regulator MalT
MAAHDDPILTARGALRRGDWSAARRRFEEALESDETAEALEGLSDALFWLDDPAGSIRHRERAHALYRDRADARAAARTALFLARTYFSAYSNVAAGNGWLQRAERLLAETGPCAECGWLEQLRAKCASDPATTVRLARRATEVAREHGDPDLEVWSLSEQGRALVAMGRVDEGMALLDEAAAAATAGEACSLLAVGDTCCNMLSACDRAADFERAMQWCRVVDGFARRHHATSVFQFCRVVYGGVLMATGRWDEAEAELRRGLDAANAYPAEAVHSLSRLALLSVRRGRLEEAAQLLVGFESHGAATEAVAALHLARGQTALACAVLERRLGAGPVGLAAVPLLGLLVEVRMALGRPQEARTASAQLLEVAASAGRPPIEAQAQLAAARVAQGRTAERLYEAAVSGFGASGMPYDAALARLEWAAVAAERAAEIAVEDARLALGALERLGARAAADRAAALLRRLGAGSAPGPRLSGDLTRREREVLGLLSHGLSNHEISTRLVISPKTVEHHVGRVFSKLGVRNRAEAVAWALRQAVPAADRK